MSAILLLGLMIDYGGGFGIKNIVGLMALGWVLLRPLSYKILRRHRASLFVFLGIPLFLATVHLLRLSLDPSANVSLIGYGVEFYRTISSALLILLLPLFYLAGSRVTLRQIRVGFRVLAVILLAVFALHSLNLVNLADYGQIATDRQIGFIGIDPRLPDLATSQRPVLSLRVAFAMPLALALELASSITGALLVFVSLLAVGSRGLLIGAILLFVLWILASLGTKRLMIVLVRLWPMILVLVLIVLLSEPIRFRFNVIFLERLKQSVRGTDVSTQIRVGHVEGYLNLVEEKPWVLLVGVGPGGTFLNPRLGYPIALTEMPILNLTLWYGLPYTILYTLWLYRAAWRLWRLHKAPGFDKTDLALILGTVIFWFTGNFNPMMISPFGFIAYTLLLVRIAELRAHARARFEQ